MEADNNILSVDRVSKFSTGDEDVDFLISPNGDAWLTTDCIARIIGKGAS